MILREKNINVSIKLKKNQGLVSLTDIPDKSGIAGFIFAELASMNLFPNIITEVSDGKGFCHTAFTINRTSLNTALEKLKYIQKSIKAEKLCIETCVYVISIIRTDNIKDMALTNSIFRILDKENINIKMVSTSDIKIEIVINDEDGDRAYKIINDLLNV